MCVGRRAGEVRLSLWRTRRGVQIPPPRRGRGVAQWPRARKPGHHYTPADPTTLLPR